MIGVLEGASLEVVDITISGLADYYAVRNSKIDNKVGAIINLGHATTDVSIISDGILVNTETIQLGGINIEKDIAYVFGTNIIDARKIKEKFASCHKRFTNLNDVYELKNDMNESVKLNQLEVTEVVMSRMIEILEYAKIIVNDNLSVRDIENISKNTGEDFKESKNIFDFCIRLKVNRTSKAKFTYLEDGWFKHVDLGRTTRYFCSNTGGGLSVFYNGSEKANRLSKDYNFTIFNKYYDSDDYDINYQFYITEANKIKNVVEDMQLNLF